jgi:hypothetical protein
MCRLLRCIAETNDDLRVIRNKVMRPMQLSYSKKEKAPEGAFFMPSQITAGLRLQ